MCSRDSTMIFALLLVTTCHSATDDFSALPDDTNGSVPDKVKNILRDEYLKDENLISHLRVWDGVDHLVDNRLKVEKLDQWHEIDVNAFMKMLDQLMKLRKDTHQILGNKELLDRLEKFTGCIEDFPTINEDYIQEKLSISGSGTDLQNDYQSCHPKDMAKLLEIVETYNKEIVKMQPKFDQVKHCLSNEEVKEEFSQITDLYPELANFTDLVGRIDTENLFQSCYDGDIQRFEDIVNKHDWHTTRLGHDNCGWCGADFDDKFKRPIFTDLARQLYVCEPCWDDKVTCHKCNHLLPKHYSKKYRPKVGKKPNGKPKRENRYRCEDADSCAKQNLMS